MVSTSYWPQQAAAGNESPSNLPPDIQGFVGENMYSIVLQALLFLLGPGRSSSTETTVTAEAILAHALATHPRFRLGSLPPYTLERKLVGQALAEGRRLQLINRAESAGGHHTYSVTRKFGTAALAAWPLKALLLVNRTSCGCGCQALAHGHTLAESAFVGYRGGRSHLSAAIGEASVQQFWKDMGVGCCPPFVEEFLAGYSPKDPKEEVKVEEVAKKEEEEVVLPPSPGVSSPRRKTQPRAGGPTRKKTQPSPVGVLWPGCLPGTEYTCRCSPERRRRLFLLSLSAGTSEEEEEGAPATPAVVKKRHPPKRKAVAQGSAAPLTKRQRKRKAAAQGSVKAKLSRKHAAAKGTRSILSFFTKKAVR